MQCTPEDVCMLLGSCASGVCSGAVPRGCYDADSCTYDTCASQDGCEYVPIPGVCGHAGLPGAFVFVRDTPVAGAAAPDPFVLGATERRCPAPIELRCFVR